EKPPLLVAQVARNSYVHEQAVVSAPESLEDRHALPAQDSDLARLSACFELELDIAVERGHRRARAERGLGHRQVDGRDDVVAVADEARIGEHPDEDIGVPGPPAELAGVPFPGDADPLAVVDPLRYVDIQGALLRRPSAAAAVRARRGDDLASAGASRTSPSTDELAEHRRG